MAEQLHNHGGDRSGGLEPVPPGSPPLDNINAEDPVATLMPSSNPFEKPQVFNLAHHFSRYGLTPSQANVVLNRFSYRCDGPDCSTIYKPSVIVLHIQQGVTRGSLLEWVNTRASSGVMVEGTGELLRVIPDAYAPWSNGDVKTPSSRGQRLLDRFNGADPNLYSVTLEMEGMNNQKIGPRALETACWMCAEWMARHGLGLDDIYRHADFNTVTRGFCPGEYFMQVMDRLERKM